MVSHQPCPPGFIIVVGERKPYKGQDRSTLCPQPFRLPTGALSSNGIFRSLALRVHPETRSFDAASFLHHSSLVAGIEHVSLLGGLDWLAFDRFLLTMDYLLTAPHILAFFFVHELNIQQPP